MSAATGSARPSTKKEGKEKKEKKDVKKKPDVPQEPFETVEEYKKDLMVMIYSKNLTQTHFNITEAAQRLAAQIYLSYAGDSPAMKTDSKYSHLTAMGKPNMILDAHSKPLREILSGQKNTAKSKEDASSLSIIATLTGKAQPSKIKIHNVKNDIDVMQDAAVDEEDGPISVKKDEKKKTGEKKATGEKKTPVKKILFSLHRLSIFLIRLIIARAYGELNKIEHDSSTTIDNVLEQMRKVVPNSLVSIMAHIDKNNSKYIQSCRGICGEFQQKISASAAVQEQELSELAGSSSGEPSWFSELIATIITIILAKAARFALFKNSSSVTVETLLGILADLSADYIPDDPKKQNAFNILVRNINKIYDHDHPPAIREEKKKVAQQKALEKKQKIEEEKKKIEEEKKKNGDVTPAASKAKAKADAVEFDLEEPPKEQPKNKAALEPSPAKPAKPPAKPAASASKNRPVTMFDDEDNE